MIYIPDSPPGTYDHRSGDCPIHGVNVCFAKPYKTTTPPRCIECWMKEEKK